MKRPEAIANDIPTALYAGGRFTVAGFEAALA